MFDDSQMAILESLETPDLDALFKAHGGYIWFDQLTPQETKILAPYYLKRLLFLYDDLELAQSHTTLGYTKRKATKLTLERIKRHREERDAVAVHEGFSDYLHLLHNHDQAIENEVLANIKQNHFHIR